MPEYYVYILANNSNRVLYIGVTNDLERRLAEHKSAEGKSFTQKYRVRKLVFFEACATAADAIGREKQLKKWSRRKKIALIDLENPEWKDLSECK